MITEGYLARHYQGRHGGRAPALLDVAQDYALHLLHDEGVFDLGLTFKGGTALRKYRAGNLGRFSTDLDFAAVDPEIGDVVFEILDGALVVGVDVHLFDGHVQAFRHPLQDRPGVVESLCAPEIEVCPSAKALSTAVASRSPGYEPDLSAFCTFWDPPDPAFSWQLRSCRSPTVLQRGSRRRTQRAGGSMRRAQRRDFNRTEMRPGFTAAAA